MIAWCNDHVLESSFHVHPARCEVLLAQESFAEPQQSASWWSISEEPEGADQKLWGFGKWYWLTHDLHVMGTSSRYGSSKLQHCLVIHQDITYCWKAKVGFGDMWINCWVVQISWKENPFWQICPLRLYACKMSPLIFGTSHQLEGCIWTAEDSSHASPGYLDLHVRCRCSEFESQRGAGHNWTKVLGGMIQHWYIG